MGCSLTIHLDPWGYPVAPVAVAEEQQSPRYDWILWIDCDAFFMDPGALVSPGGMRNMAVKWRTRKPFTVFQTTIDIWRFPARHGGTPIVAGWSIIENPFKMDDLGVPPISGNLHIGFRWVYKPINQQR